ncbi:MAG: hypothetical protein ACO3Z6_03585 [Pseudomonadales bacterium]
MEQERLLPGSIPRTLAGEADLRVGAVVREAWHLLPGIKTPLLAGGGLVYGGVFFLLGVLGASSSSAESGVNPVFELFAQLVAGALLYPFLAGVFLFGLRRSLGREVRFDDLFSQYSRVVPLLLVGLLQSLAVTLGLLMLLLPGLYLAQALSLAVALKAERDLPTFECLALSLRLVNKAFWRVVLLSMISGSLILLGILSVIGWIWTLPWAAMIFAITYRQLAGTRDGATGFETSPPGPGRERVKGIVEM